MQSLEFSSMLPDEFRQDLESLLFYNPRQVRARDGIVQSIERYGQPRILSDNGMLRVAVGDLQEVQTLFALVPRGDSHDLAGVAVYTREEDRLTILHLSVAEDVAAGDGDDDALLAVRLAGAIRAVAGNVRGIRHVQLPYGVRSEQHLRPAGAERR